MMEVAAVVRGVAHIRRDIGHGSSFDAEWLALEHAVYIATTQGLTDYVLLGDCASVIAQATGSAKGGAAAAHRARILAMLQPGGALRLRHIKRTQNLAGIALAKLHDQ